MTMGLNKMLIGKYASKGRSYVISEFKEKYLSKKGDRFFVDGITYEIGQIFQEKNEMEIEISSKIPVDEITGGNKEEFFNMIKKKLEKQKSPPYYIGMDDIVKKIGERKIKKRDYIRLKYRSAIGDFYDDKEIMKETERIDREQDMTKVLMITEVSSIPGKLVLASIEDGFSVFIRDKVNEMVKANQDAKKKYATTGAAT